MKGIRLIVPESAVKWAAGISLASLLMTGTNAISYSYTNQFLNSGNYDTRLNDQKIRQKNYASFVPTIDFDAPGYSSIITFPFRVAEAVVYPFMFGIGEEIAIKLHERKAHPPRPVKKKIKTNGRSMFADSYY